MKLVLQRVLQASVDVNEETVGRIDKGLLVFCCVEKGDDESVFVRMAKKLVEARIFEDNQGKMNNSLLSTGGGLLLVSQFTLAADLRKGNRPSFETAEKPEPAREKIQIFKSKIEALGVSVQEGRFGKMMKVSLINDGPVTFVLQSS